MGSCTFGRKLYAPQDFQVVPQMIESLNPLNPINLNKELKRVSFQCELNNIQLVGPFQQQISVKFMIENVMEIQLPKKPFNLSNNKFEWKTQDTFAIKGIQYEVYNKFLQIYINTTKSKTPIAKYKINIYHIITGPYHHDFKVVFASNPQSQHRFRFDLKIIQILDIEFIILSNEVQLDDDYPGQKFNFTIQSFKNSPKIINFFDTLKPQALILAKQDSYQSQPSYSVQTPIVSSNQYRQLTQQEKQVSKKRLLRKISNIVTVPNISKMKWDRSQSQKMPTFKLKIKTSEIINAILGVTLWKQSIQDKNKKFVKFGCMLLPLHQFLQDYQHSIQQTYPSYKENKKYQQKILDKSVLKGQLKCANSKIVGKCKIGFSVKNKQYLEHLPGSIRTQCGIIDKFNHEIYYIKNEKMLEKTIQNITKLYQQLVNQHKTLLTIKNRISRLSQHQKIADSLMKLSTQLQKNNKFQSNNWKSQSIQLIQRQNILLSTLSFMKTILDIDHISINQYTWKIIYLIIKNNCFELRYIGFKNTKKQSSSQLINKKVETALKYQEILYSLLKIGLNYYSYNTDLENNYSQKFKTYCYFAIPIFRQKILLYLEDYSGQNDDQSQFNLLGFKSPLKNKQKINSQKLIQQQQLVLNTLDYKKYFYSQILNNQISINHDKQLKQMLKTCNWFKNSNIHEQFYQFIQHVILNFQDLLKNYSTSNNSFKYLPGIQKITNWVIFCLKTTQILKFQKKGLNTLTSTMLLNEDLINLFLPIVFQKINANNTIHILKLLQILQKYFKILTRKHKLQKSFPTVYFWKTIKILLENQSVLVISRLLLLIYNYFDKFNQLLITMIIRDLLTIVFNKMFYHWSKQVRKLFHHIILFKIAQHNELQQNLILTNLLELRIKSLSIIQHQQKTKKTKIIAFNMRINHNDSQFIRMKQKLWLKKKGYQSANEMFNLKNQQIKKRKLSVDDSLQKGGQYHQISLVNLKIYSGKDGLFNQGSFKLRTKPSFVESIKLIDITERVQQDNQQNGEDNKTLNDQIILYQIRNEVEDQYKPYVIQAISQFKQLNDKTQNYVRLYQKIPQNQIDSILIFGIDKKDIKPTSQEYFQ